MAEDLIREPDEDSGPAVLDREPVVLPEQRKNIADKGKEAAKKARDKLGL